MTDLHFVVPDAIDDPRRPSGGNLYDRHVGAGLRALGWAVVEHRVSGAALGRGHGPGSGSGPDSSREPESASAALHHALGTIPTGSVVLLDGLIASGSPNVLVPAAARLRLVVLVHLPLGHAWSAGADGSDGPSGDPRESRVLTAAAAVIATSGWTRCRLLELYPLDPARVHVAEPGVDPAALGLGTPAGSALLCVAAVTPDKGHDLLLAALATVSDLPWQCTCAGALDLDPGWLEHLRHLARRAGIADRVHFVGPLPCTDLDRAYAAADVLVHASSGETYAMVVTEALARGLPVIATSVGGLPEALGHASGGDRPGLLVPAGDPELFGATVRSWLVDEGLRQELRARARARRAALSGWSVTARSIAEVLDRVAHPGRAAPS